MKNMSDVQRHMRKCRCSGERYGKMLYVYAGRWRAMVSKEVRMISMCICFDI